MISELFDKYTHYVKVEGKKLPDISDLLDQVVARNIDPTVFLDIEENDIPKAPNCVKFFLGRKFLNLKPLPKQLQICLNLFEEYCPLCSRMPVNNIDDNNMFDQPLAEILDKIQLLNFGICPNCGKTKWDFHKAGYFFFRHTLAGCAGQRCITGDTIIQTKKGLFDIEQFDEDCPVGFSSINEFLYNGEKFDKATKFFVSKICKVKRIKTKYGTELGGSLEHPIQIFDGNEIVFRKLKNIKRGDALFITYGQNVWPKKEFDISWFDKDWNKNFDRRTGKYVSTYCNKDLSKHLWHPKIPTKMSLSLAKFLGYMTAEGYVNSGDMNFSNNDKNILNEFESISIKLFGKGDYIERFKNCVCIRSNKIFEFLKWLGCTGLSSEKKIPNCIMQSPKKYASAFLSTYFEGDGGMVERDLECSSISKKLIQQIRILLLNYGILPCISESKTWASNGTENQVEKDGYTLCISSDEFLKLFQQEIGFISSRKKKLLQQAIFWYENKREKHTPFRHEYLEALNSYFIETLLLYRKILWSKELRQGKNNNIAKDKVGLETVFGGRKTSPCNKYWRVGGHSNLTRKLLESFVSTIEQSPYYSERWDEKLIERIRFLRYILNNKVYFDYVISIKNSKERTYDFYIPKSHKFWSNGVISHNSGKSLLCDDFILPYILHRYLTTGRRGIRISPQNYFGLLPTTIFQLTATALTVTKALDLIWNPFMQTLKRAPWFINYHEFLDRIGKEKGEPLYLSGSTFFFYAHKLIAGGIAAPDFGKLRGPTRLASIVDEIDFFDTQEDSTKQTLSAEEISKSLTNSLRTIRNRANKFRKNRSNWLSAYHIEVSSPSSIDGKILRDIRMAEESTSKRTLGFHLSTWEMNPDFTFEDFEEEFETDPVKTWRDFGAVPPLAGDSPFFENVDVLRKSQRNEKQDILSYTVKYHKDNLGSLTLYAEVKVNYVDNVPRLLTIDKGHSINSFAIILSHLENEKPFIDFILIVRPEIDSIDKKKIKINTHLMYEHAIEPILNNLRITQVVYDRWESLDSIRKIRDEKGIQADQYSLQPKDLSEIVKPAINEIQGISYPKALIEIDRLDVINYSKDFGGVDDIINQSKSCPVSTLMVQLLTVREVGRKVVKPLNGDDDAFRAFCLSLIYLLNTEINWKFKGTGALRSSRKGNRMGAVFCYSERGNTSQFAQGKVSKIGRCASNMRNLLIPSRTSDRGGRIGRIAKQEYVNKQPVQKV